MGGPEPPQFFLKHFFRPKDQSPRSAAEAGERPEGPPPPAGEGGGGPEPPQICFSEKFSIFCQLFFLNFFSKFFLNFFFQKQTAEAM